ncbi:MAG: hypothetical protein E5Y32_02380 [Mesorhizobium sp.]|nr:MAG: hypothetical protein E5Y32_02380 [Mesorhizobium sp.]
MFDKFRRDINRTHKRSIDLANRAKREYLDANLNIMLDPDFELPIGDGTRRPVADILAETLIGKSRSPEAEAKAAARTVKKSVRTLAEKEPGELLEFEPTPGAPRCPTLFPWSLPSAPASAIGHGGGAQPEDLG